MYWTLLLKIVTVFYILKLSESSYVQKAKHRILAEVGDIIGPSKFAPDEYEHFDESSKRRVHRLHGRHRNRWSSGHRKSIEQHHFTGWSAWSVCNTECIKRRERYCKLKRKCGLTKHVEERKCLHCIPKIVWQEQAIKNVDNISHQQQQQQQQQQQTINGGSATPSIIINAAAAASGPMHHQYIQPIQHYSTTSAPPTPLPAHKTIIHHKIRLPILQEIISYSHQHSPNYHDDTDDHNYHQQYHEQLENYFDAAETPQDDEVTIEPPADLDAYDNENDNGNGNENENKNENEYEYEDEDEDENQDDFYALKTKPRYYRKQRKQIPIYIDSSEYSDLEAEDFDGNVAFGINDRKRQRKHSKRRKGRQQQIKAPRLRNFSPNIDDGIEGDTFQYEDFDLVNGVDGNGNGNGKGNGNGNGNGYGYGNLKFDNQPVDSYDEYNDYDDIVINRNSTFLLQSKEKAIPDALIPRHRRLYSKWSRWTKCSPKCTTRRYKKCRVREQCGHEVLREIAYCYTEGSFCQQWLQAQVQRSSPYELRPMMAAASRRRDISTDGNDGGGFVGGGTQSNSIVSDYIMNSKGYRGPEYTPMKLKCGIAPMRNGKRSMYNMLKIIGGKAARKGEWPWQVAIFNRFKEAFCGGTLIAPQWVLTAAHCVRKVLYVRIGEHNLDYEDGTEMQLRVLKSFKHPNFDKKTVDSDVALLRLPKPVNTTTWIGFSCLPRPFQPLPKNMDCTVIGWGKRRNRDAAGTSVLHQADVPIISMDNCRSVYQDYTITKNMFCAGHKRGRIDTCAGDSGGPLLCRDTTKPNHPWTIFGITSFGDGCAKRNKFGIYAKVPNYVDWVWSVINCNGNCKLNQRNYG